MRSDQLMLNQFHVRCDLGGICNKYNIWRVGSRNGYSVVLIYGDAKRFLGHDKTFDCTIS